MSPLSVASSSSDAVATRNAAKPLASRIGWILPGGVLALFALKALGPVRDPDTFWHLRAGEHLLSSGQFVLDDPFGSGAQRPWILNQWLPEVLLHGADATFGLPGVAWLLCLATVLVGASVWAACRRSSSPLVTALVLVVAFLAMAGSLSPRPQLVTFALAALTMAAWLRSLDDRRVRWWLIPVSWLWACSHGMWFIGPALGAIAVVGGVLDRRLAPREAARQALVPLLSVAAAALTPVGPRLFTSPFQVADVTPYVTEWQATSLADPGLWAALALVVPVVAAGLMRHSRLPWTTTLFVVLAVYLAFAHARTVALAAIVVAPLASNAIQLVLRMPRDDLDRRERVATAVFPAVALTLAAVLAPSVAAQAALGAPGLNGQLSAMPAGTVVCNDEVAGGWLEWAHPDLRPTMDTRVEIRSAGRIHAYHQFVEGVDGWQTYPSALGCAAVFLTREAPVVQQLLAAGWKQVSDADGYVLLSGPP